MDDNKETQEQAGFDEEEFRQRVLSLKEEFGIEEIVLSYQVDRQAVGYMSLTTGPMISLGLGEFTSISCREAVRSWEAAQRPDALADLIKDLSRPMQPKKSKKEKTT